MSRESCSGRNPMLRVLDLIWRGPFVVHSVHVVARLGIADLLGPEPQTVDELAEAVKADAPSLKRVLRALTTLGVFSEDADGRFPTHGAEPDAARRPSRLRPRVGANAGHSIRLAPGRRPLRVRADGNTRVPSS